MTSAIPCSILRGGTSKGIYVLDRDLPAPGPRRDAVLLRLVGSPDNRQIDGLGGATSVTSKVAIIRKSDRQDADVDYTFAQVSVDKPIVSYAGNCGNILSGVGPFAIENGMVPVLEGTTQVRIYNTNTESVILSSIRTHGGCVVYEGDCHIAGVPGTAAPVKLEFENPAGAVTGKLLPTGRPSDIWDVPTIGVIHISIVDAANPLVFVSAEEVGLSGAESPAQINADAALLEKLERIRAYAAVTLGFISEAKESTTRSPGVPKLAVIARPADYTATDGRMIPKKSFSLLGRMLSMQKAHETYALTGAICTACAACIQGTIVNRAMEGGGPTQSITIGHPGGTMTIGVNYNRTADGGFELISASGLRTARLLMRGVAFI